MKIMVTGAGGFVGSRRAAYYGKKYDVWGVTHKDLDLTDEAAVFKTVENYHPDVLIHCADVYKRQAIWWKHPRYISDRGILRTFMQDRKSVV